MRTFSVLVSLGLLALVCGYSVPGKLVKTADNDLLHKQKLIFELLQHFHQNDVLPKLYDDIKAYHFDEHYDYYNNVDQIKEFVQLYKTGLIGFDEHFSIFNEYHRRQFLAYFRVVYNAKDWDTFYKTLVWGRFRINKGMYLYALTAAVIQRHDLAGLELPAPYEIYPQYFFTSETIQTAQNYKMQGFAGVKKVDNVYTVIVPSNYTSSYMHFDSEEKLAYYREDVGLNAMYYYRMTDYPFWLGGQEYNLYKDRRGEQYLFFIQQSLSRYFLERLSNGLGVIPDLSLYKTIEHGYNPMLRYHNGDVFPSREDEHICYHDEQNYYGKMLLDDYIQRISDAIDAGHIMLPDGKYTEMRKPEHIDMLGNLLQSNGDSMNHRYYGNIEELTRLIIGGTYGVHNQYQNVVPSILEHYETSMRDPVFYQMYKRLIQLYWQFKDNLPSYKYEEIAFQGVKIESVDVDKLVTYFDIFDSDITAAVNVDVIDDQVKRTEFMEYGRISQYDGHDFVIKARQWRLNHLPFTVKMNVYSDKAVTGVVRMYLGPKYDEIGHEYITTEHRENWYYLDSFKYDLVAGKNVVTRDSQDMYKYIKDRTTYYDLYKWVMTAEKGQTTFPLDMTEAHNGIPSRMMLPRGRKGGMPFRLYFIISPYHAPTVEQYTGYDHIVSSGIGSGARFIDTLPFGYPFDRPIDKTVWYTPNMYYQDVSIFHKTETEVNAVH